MLIRQALGHVSEAKARQRGVEHLGRGVAHELAFDAHLQLAAGLFKLPGIQSTARRQPQVDAVVADQVLRPFRFRALAEVGWSADHRHPRIRADAHCDHVFRHLLAAANARVEALGDDVGQSVVDGDLDLDVGMSAEEFGEFRQEDGVGGVRGGRDADGAGGLAAKLAHRLKLRFDLRQSRARDLEQALARLGRCNASRGTGQQPDAKPRLEFTDATAEGGLREPELGGCAGEAQLPRHSREQHKFLDGLPVHL